MIKKNLLITGKYSGLGKYLKKKFNSCSFNRDKKFLFYKKKKWNLVIHCGFYNGTDKEKFLESIQISKKITSLNTKKIIFITSLIIYDKKKSLYKKSKIISENFFRNKKNSYIIRLGALVGSEMRRNTISKIVYDRKPKIGLSERSRYSFIHYDEVYCLINKIIKQKKIMITDFFRRDFVTLKKISNILKKKIKFGNFLVKCVDAPYKRKIDFYNILKKQSSIDIIKKL